MAPIVFNWRHLALVSSTGQVSIVTKIILLEILSIIILSFIKRISKMKSFITRNNSTIELCFFKQTIHFMTQRNGGDFNKISQ